MIVFRAPDDCLQYYTGSFGEFKSFNFANGKQRSLTFTFTYQSSYCVKSEKVWTWASCRPTALQPGLQSLLQTRAWSAIYFIISIDSALKIQRRLCLCIFSDYCAISYRASLSPTDAFEMLTCEKQSSSFKHGFLMNLVTTYLLNIIMTW